MKPLNIVLEKFYAYDKLHTDVDIQSTANAIVDLCQDRDNHRYDVFTSSDTPERPMGHICPMFFSCIYSINITKKKFLNSRQFYFR